MCHGRNKLGWDKSRNIAERMPVPVDIQNIFMHFSKINA
jgi:hypothetical protein